ncbi:hypothetical protein NC797_05990 [Aquibacillus sp. 3ASR75-11]|uniref:Uncharacterized protein n=1 Tax=Terrihalobacillus insolitus TaxID=2950438 RepID=A0A9X3WTP6_9BACI|nr:hypothetical protein [Terrihalobacillus insolitus]MDC3415172.1 hypothetical protein [Terrihalobacillus insolitus]MDC3424056.1 hypothetical protein [Terrihalobacillus insolitus]
MNYQALKDYDVFTRIQRGESIIQIGSFKAPDDDIATVYAQKIYDEQDWAEMQVVRRDHIIKIKVPEGVFAQKGVK